MVLKKGILKSCLPFVAILMFLSSCYQDSSEFVTTGADGEVGTFYSDVQDPANVRLFNSELGTVIETEDFSRIEVPSKAFVDEDQQLLVDEDIRLEYRILKEKGDLIRFNKPTISDGALLETGGVILLKASNVSRTLNYSLSPNKSISVQLSDLNPNDEMMLFYGDDSSSSYNWDLYSEGIQTAVWGNATDSIEVVGYDFEMDSLTWVNCDVFSNIAQNEQTGICVELPEIFTNVNTALFVVFKERRSVVSLSGNPDLEQFCDPYQMMPIGDEVDIISVTSLDNGVYYFGMKNVVLSSNNQEFLEPERKTIEEINEILNTL